MDARRAAALVMVASALLLAAGGQGFGAKIPRATCLDCHEKEGMKYATVILTPFLEIPQNETSTLEVVVANPWLHDITDVQATVSLVTPTLSFIVQKPFNATETGVLGAPPAGTDAVSIPFAVSTGATGLLVRMTETPGPQAADGDLSLLGPDGVEHTPPEPDGLEANPPSREVRDAASLGYDAAAASALGTGNFTAFARTSRLQGALTLGAPTPVTLDVHVFYNASTMQIQRKIVSFKQPDSESLRFDIQGSSPGPARIDVAVTVTTHYIHPKGIGAQDDGNETLTSRIDFEVGQQRRLGEQTALATAIPRNWNLVMTVWGEVTGWIGLFLVPISLVLGGA
ncbi:MAG: hypothetical protein ACRDH5_16505, partial [bacterium]